MKKQNYNQPSLYALLEDVCATQEVTVDAIASKSRKVEVARIRHLYCYVAGLYTKCTYKQIGETIGNRDHSTVLNSIATAQDMLDTSNPKFLEKFESFKSTSKYFANMVVVRNKRSYLKND